MMDPGIKLTTIDSWGMKVEGWEAVADLCTRGTGDMARS